MQPLRDATGARNDGLARYAEIARDWTSRRSVVEVPPDTVIVPNADTCPDDSVLVTTDRRGQ